MNGSPVFSIWDPETANYITSTHPCKTPKCTIYHVSFGREHGDTQLQTGCACGKLCLWDISLHSTFLLNETRIHSHGIFKWWAENGSKAVFMTDTKERMSHPTVFAIIGISTPYHELCSGWQGDKWLFSPGKGEKVIHLREWSKVLRVWACSSGEQLFTISLPQRETFTRAQFSPDSDTIIYSSWDKTMKRSIALISAQTGVLLWRHNQTELRNIQYCPNSTQIIGLNMEGISTINPSTGVITPRMIPRGAWEHSSGRLGVVSLSPDEKMIAIFKETCTEVFNLISGDCLATHRFKSRFFTYYHFSWSHSFFIYATRNSIEFYPVLLSNSDARNAEDATQASELQSSIAPLNFIPPLITWLLRPLGASIIQYSYCPMPYRSVPPAKWAIAGIPPGLLFTCGSCSSKHATQTSK